MSSPKDLACYCPMPINTERRFTESRVELPREEEPISLGERFWTGLTEPKQHARHGKQVDPLAMSDVQEVFVAEDDDGGASGEGSGENRVVIRVGCDNGCDWSGPCY